MTPTTKKAAIIGGGVIGGGWAARFLLNGWDVKIFDPDPQAERVLGKLWWDLWPLESRGYVREQFSKALNGKPVTFEASCPTFKGNPRNWSVSLKPMVARAGPVVSVLATSREI